MPFKYHRRKKVWETAVHLAAACDVFDGVFFCAVPFPTGCLG